MSHQYSIPQSTSILFLNTSIEEEQVLSSMGRKIYFKLVYLEITFVFLRISLIGSICSLQHSGLFHVKVTQASENHHQLSPEISTLLGKTLLDSFPVFETLYYSPSWSYFSKHITLHVLYLQCGVWNSIYHRCDMATQSSSINLTAMEKIHFNHSWSCLVN